MPVMKPLWSEVNFTPSSSEFESLLLALTGVDVAPKIVHGHVVGPGVGVLVGTGGLVGSGVCVGVGVAVPAAVVGVGVAVAGTGVLVGVALVVKTASTQ